MSSKGAIKLPCKKNTLVLMIGCIAVYFLGIANHLWLNRHYCRTKTFVDETGQYSITLRPDGRDEELVTLAQCGHYYGVMYFKIGPVIYTFGGVDQYLTENDEGLVQHFPKESPCADKQLYDVESKTFTAIKVVREKRREERIRNL